jgi:hypothetical protein
MGTDGLINDQRLTCAHIRCQMRLMTSRICVRFRGDAEVDPRAHTATPQYVRSWRQTEFVDNIVKLTRFTHLVGSL